MIHKPEEWHLHGTDLLRAVAAHVAPGEPIENFEIQVPAPDRIEDETQMTWAILKRRVPPPPALPMDKKTWERLRPPPLPPGDRVTMREETSDA